MQWNFETWNEPDHHDFDNLNFTIQGFLNYYDACSDGLKRAHKGLKFGGPGGSCRIPSVGHSPICWALLEHCVDGHNYFNGNTTTRLDYISFHKKGNASTSLILEEELQTIKYIKAKYPALINIPFYNDEADPLKNWALPVWWRGDSTYAAMVVKVILKHVYLYYFQNKSSKFVEIDFKLLSNDNAFLSYYPNQFTTRTLLARFQINNTIPKYVDFIKKPVYSVFGLLSHLCSQILPIQLKTSNAQEERYLLENIGILATQCFSLKHIAVILYNVDETFKKKLNASIAITLNSSNAHVDTRWVTLDVNNEDTNPYHAWKTLGMPPYPTIYELSFMKKFEEPVLKGPFKTNVSIGLNFNIILRDSSVMLINICLEPEILKEVKNIRFLPTLNNTLQISWDSYNRCILTYNVLYSPEKHGSYVRINFRKIIYSSYWHACINNVVKCRVEGFYKVYYVDFWHRLSPISKEAYFFH